MLSKRDRNELMAYMMAYIVPLSMAGLYQYDEPYDSLDEWGNPREDELFGVDIEKEHELILLKKSRLSANKRRLVERRYKVLVREKERHEKGII